MRDFRSTISEQHIKIRVKYYLQNNEKIVLKVWLKLFSIYQFFILTSLKIFFLRFLLGPNMKNLFRFISMMLKSFKVITLKIFMTIPI